MQGYKFIDILKNLNSLESSSYEDSPEEVAEDSDYEESSSYEESPEEVAEDSDDYVEPSPSCQLDSATCADVRFVNQLVQ